MKEIKKCEWFQDVQAAYFYHRFVQHGFNLYTDFGYRYKFNRFFSSDVSLGAPAACSLFQPQLITCSAGIIEKRIKKSGDKKIGNIWFDSHGHYANGYSSFSIGRDEFNFVNIKDSMYNQSLKCIAKHCDEFTQIAIGSCYGGATFTFPGSPKVHSQPMNGDSLMIGAGKISTCSYIYGCESFVMMKPGVFNDGYALAGYPLNKRFKDVGFKHVWERLGEWHRYQHSTNTFENVNTVALNKYGEICLLKKDYQDLSKKKEIIERKIDHLKPDLYKKFLKEPHMIR